MVILKKLIMALLFHNRWKVHLIIDRLTFLCLEKMLFCLIRIIIVLILSMFINRKLLNYLYWLLQLMSHKVMLKMWNWHVWNSLYLNLSFCWLLFVSDPCCQANALNGIIMVLNELLWYFQARFFDVIFVVYCYLQFRR